MGSHAGCSLGAVLAGELFKGSRGAIDSPATNSTTAAVSIAPSAPTVPEGTLVSVWTMSALSTNTLESGQILTANLAQPVVCDRRAAIAAEGAAVRPPIAAVFGMRVGSHGW